MDTALGLAVILQGLPRIGMASEGDFRNCGESKHSSDLRKNLFLVDPVMTYPKGKKLIYLSSYVFLGLSVSLCYV